MSIAICDTIHAHILVKDTIHAHIFSYHAHNFFFLAIESKKLKENYESKSKIGV